jgi:wyosine [tRNA(Phe)-imidazoG37] synthetase (radical SAM superfamily)
MDTVHLKDVLDGLIQFKKQFQGVLFIDTKFVYSINDTDRNLIGLIDYIKELNPDKYTIIHRKHKGKNPTDDFMKLTKEHASQLKLQTEIYP